MIEICSHGLRCYSSSHKSSSPLSIKRKVGWDEERMIALGGHHDLKRQPSIEIEKVLCSRHKKRLIIFRNISKDRDIMSIN